MEFIGETKRVFVDCSNPETERETIKNWIEQNKVDFIAHAVWNGFKEEDLKYGAAVYPAEARLYLTGQVEYEKGSTRGSRGYKYLIEELDSRALEIFESLSKSEMEELKYLEELQTRTNEEEYQAFKSLKKRIISFLPEDEQELYLWFKSLGNNQKCLKLEGMGIEKLTEEEKREFEKLSEKRNFFDQRSRFKYLLRKKQGIDIEFENNGKEVTAKGCFLRYGELRKQGYSDPSDAALKYFYKKDILNKYLAHKYEKWTKKGISPMAAYLALQNAHDKVLCLQSSKLNFDIRAMKSKIAWSYGNTIILRGKTEGITSHNASNEVFLLAPWQNRGEYFSLPLAQEDTIVIGPRNELEPIVKVLKTIGAKFAYLESLTKEQKEFFEVPEHLI